MDLLLFYVPQSLSATYKMRSRSSLVDFSFFLLHNGVLFIIVISCLGFVFLNIIVRFFLVKVHFVETLQWKT